MNYVALALAVALLISLSGCSITETAADLAKRAHDRYCTSTSPEARELLRQQLVHEDGSPLFQVFCDPHGGTSVRQVKPGGLVV